MKNITWDKYFAALAEVSGMRSKDPNTKVGACIVNENNRVIALGYNGMPGGNDNFPWGRDGATKDTKYPYVVHAEMNAILNATNDITNGSIYVSLFPCSNCAKLLVQAGIKEVVYTNDKYKDTEDNIISKDIFEMSGVTVREMPPIEILIK